MTTSLIILFFIFLTIVGIAFYSINSRRPKFFTGDLKVFEKSLFRELENKLPQNVGQLIPKQLGFLKRGVRLYFPKSYTLELYGDNTNPLSNELLFNRKDEFKLATISFTHNDIKYKADFQTYSGRVWGMTVRPSPKKILETKITNFDKFKITNDPEEKHDFEIVTEFYADNETFNGSLQDLKQKYSLTQIKKPLPDKQRQLFIKQSETTFPTDFILLCEQTNGFIIDEVSVSGLGSWQSVTLEDDNYLILAEKNSGCLTIKQSKRSRKLKYHSYEEETDIRDLGDNFLNALDTFLKIE
jgi:hypothetical protein